MFALTRRPKDAPLCEVQSLRVCRAANTVGSVQKVIASVEKLNIATKQQPIGTRLANGHSDAAAFTTRVVSNHSIKLHVGVTGDHHGESQSLKNRQQAVLRREANENFDVVARRCMAEKDFPGPGILVWYVDGQLETKR